MPYHHSARIVVSLQRRGRCSLLDSTLWDSLHGLAYTYIYYQMTYLPTHTRYYYLARTWQESYIILNGRAWGQALFLYVSTYVATIAGESDGYADMYLVGSGTWSTKAKASEGRNYFEDTLAASRPCLNFPRRLLHFLAPRLHLIPFPLPQNRGPQSRLSNELVPCKRRSARGG